jgi:hypothetical protein
MSMSAQSMTSIEDLLDGAHLVAAADALRAADDLARGLDDELLVA